jgi:hypothetical protein
MKDILNFISESLEFPMKGVLKKGDEVTILWLDKNPLKKDSNTKIESIETAKVQKVVSKDVGRYSGDQHTWVYVNDIRYELRAEKKDQYLGFLDYNYKNNPDKFAIIATSEQAEKLKGNNNKLNL